MKCNTKEVCQNSSSEEMQSFFVATPTGTWRNFMHVNFFQETYFINLLRTLIQVLYISIDFYIDVLNEQRHSLFTTLPKFPIGGFKIQSHKSASWCNFNYLGFYKLNALKLFSQILLVLSLMNEATFCNCRRQQVYTKIRAVMF